jgi:hypothetical protein
VGAETLKRLLVNDCMSALPDHRTFWHDLAEWFDMEFVGGDYSALAEYHGEDAANVSLIIRNASWFGPMVKFADVPTISLLQDIATEGPMRAMQVAVIQSSTKVVFNSFFTAHQYQKTMPYAITNGVTISLPVDFSTFESGNHMGLQQALGLPDGGVIWVGSQNPIKGYEMFIRVTRVNPDIPFIAVFKDAVPYYLPPNVRAYARITHEELARLIGACRVGLCTSVRESQHLAGIEMGACGLPLVVPNTGTYWNRAEMPGVIIGEPTVVAYSAAIRQMLVVASNPNPIRAYWQGEFSPEVVRDAWTKLIAEVENAHSIA